MFTFWKNKIKEAKLLDLVTTRTVLRQFSRSYSPVRPAIKVNWVWLPNCFMIYRQVFLTFIASKSLKLCFTLNCVLKRTKSVKTISI